MSKQESDPRINRREALKSAFYGGGIIGSLMLFPSAPFVGQDIVQKPDLEKKIAYNEQRIELMEKNFPTLANTLRSQNQHLQNVIYTMESAKNRAFPWFWGGSALVSGGLVTAIIDYISGIHPEKETEAK